MNASDLKVLLVKDGSKPYAENAGGDVLSTFNRAVLGQLILTTDTFELQAGLLKSWKWNQKNGSYDLFIREDLAFHDGSLVTAKDLEFALLRGFFSKNQSFYNIYLGNILGVDTIKPGTSFLSGSVKGVTITGSHSINVKLKNPNPSFLYSLTRPYFSLAKRDALNADLMTWKKWPIGAGAYKVESEDEKSITLARVNDLSGSSKKIILYTRVDEKMLYDVSFFPISQKMQIFKTINPSAIFTLFFTNQNEISANSNFRNAVKYGINRDEVTQQDNLLRPAFEFLTSAFWQNDQSISVKHDLDKAKSYFEKVPKTLRNKVWRVPVFSFGELSENTKRRTEIIKGQFLKFGLKVEFYPSNEKFLSKNTAKDSPMAYTGRICNNVDPLLLFSSFQSNSAYKYDNAQNDLKYDAMFSEAQQAVTTVDRIKTLRALSRYTVENNFMVPIFEDVQHYYYNENSVNSFGNQTNAITLFLDQITLK